MTAQKLNKETRVLSLTKKKEILATLIQISINIILTRKTFLSGEIHNDSFGGNIV